MILRKVGESRERACGTLYDDALTPKVLCCLADYVPELRWWIAVLLWTEDSCVGEMNNNAGWFDGIKHLTSQSTRIKSKGVRCGVD